MAVRLIFLAVLLSVSTTPASAKTEQKLLDLVTGVDAAQKCGLELNEHTERWYMSMVGENSVAELLAVVERMNSALNTRSAYDAAVESGERVAFCWKLRDRLHDAGWL